MLDSVAPAMSLTGDLLLGPAGKTRASPFAGAPEGLQLPGVPQLASGAAPPVHVFVAPQAEKAPATRKTAAALARRRRAAQGWGCEESRCRLAMVFIVVGYRVLKTIGVARAGPEAGAPVQGKCTNRFLGVGLAGTGSAAVPGLFFRARRTYANTREHTR